MNTNALCRRLTTARFPGYLYPTMLLGAVVAGALIPAHAQSIRWSPMRPTSAKTIAPQMMQNTHKASLLDLLTGRVVFIELEESLQRISKMSSFELLAELLRTDKDGKTTRSLIQGLAETVASTVANYGVNRPEFLRKFALYFEMNVARDVYILTKQFDSRSKRAPLHRDYPGMPVHATFSLLREMFAPSRWSLLPDPIAPPGDAPAATSNQALPLPLLPKAP